VAKNLKSKTNWFLDAQSIKERINSTIYISKWIYIFIFKQGWRNRNSIFKRRSKV